MAGVITTWTDPADCTVHAVDFPLYFFRPDTHAALIAAVTSQAVSAVTDGLWLTVCGTSLPRVVELDPHQPVTCAACLAALGGPAVEMAGLIFEHARNVEVTA